MKKCLADIKSCQLIVFQCRQNNRRFPKLDYTIDLSLHNPDIVRLPDKIDCPQFQTANLIFRTVASCYYNYRNRGKHHIIPDSVQKLKSVADWHTYIQKHCGNITVILSQQLQSLFSVNCGHNFITVFQKLCQKFPIQLIIFYYKKLSSGGRSPRFQNGFHFTVLNIHIFIGKSQNNRFKIICLPNSCTFYIVIMCNSVPSHPIVDHKLGNLFQTLTDFVKIQHLPHSGLILRRNIIFYVNVHYFFVRFLTDQAFTYSTKYRIMKTEYLYFMCGTVYRINIAVVLAQHIDDSQQQRILSIIGNSSVCFFCCFCRRKYHRMSQFSGLQLNFHCINGSQNLLLRFQIVLRTFNTVNNRAFRTWILFMHQTSITLFSLFQLRVYNFCRMVIADYIIICIYYIHSRRILAHFFTPPGPLYFSASGSLLSILTKKCFWEIDRDFCRDTSQIDQNGRQNFIVMQ